MKTSYIQCDICNAKTVDGSDNWPDTNCLGNTKKFMNQHVVFENVWEEQKKNTLVMHFQRYDICPLCFKDIVVPCMTQLGARFREASNSW